MIVGSSTEVIRTWV